MKRWLVLPVLATTSVSIVHINEKMPLNYLLASVMHFSFHCDLLEARMKNNMGHQPWKTDEAPAVSD